MRPGISSSLTVSAASSNQPPTLVLAATDLLGTVSSRREDKGAGSNQGSDEHPERSSCLYMASCMERATFRDMAGMLMYSTWLLK